MRRLRTTGRPHRFRRDRSWPPVSGCPPVRLSTSPTIPTRPADSPRRPSAQRDRIAPAPHQAQHPQGRGADRFGDDRADGRTATSLFGRAMDSAASTGDDVLHRPAVLRRSECADDRRVRARAISSRETLLPRGVAYLSIGAPTPAGDWSVRAAMSEGDLSSWIVAGSFSVACTGSAHVYNFGVLLQHAGYLGGNPAALAAVTDGSRNVGELYGVDRWTVAPRRSRSNTAGVTRRYDYLQTRRPLQPAGRRHARAAQGHARVSRPSRSA